MSKTTHHSTYSRISAQAFAEAHDALAKPAPAAAEHVHIALEPVDPIKRRWFLISLAVTLSIAVGGWVYFFVGQMTTLAAYVPTTLSSPFVTGVINAAGSVGNQSSGEFKNQVILPAVPLLNEVKTQAETTATMGAVLDSMKSQLSNQNSQTPTN